MGIHEALANVTAEFNDHKRTTNSTHNKFQSAVWGLEENQKRQQQVIRGTAPGQRSSLAPGGASPVGSFGGASPLQAGTPQQQAQRQAQTAAAAAGLRPGSATVPQLLPQSGAAPMMGHPMGSRSSTALGTGPQLGTPAGGRSPQMHMPFGAVR